MARSLALCVLVAAVLFGCGSPLRDVQGLLGPASSPRSEPGHVDMTYLGNGGWLIRRGTQVIATAPFVSNFGGAGLRIYFPGEPRTDVIESRVPPMPDVEIMLLGHGHYDHALDVPYVLAHLARNATVYGGTTVKHLLDRTLTRAIGPDKVKDVSADAARGLVPGRWVSGRDARVRFMPLASTHAPHVLGFVKLVSWATLDADLDTTPSVPAAWPEGETLAFLIDFLDEDAKRVEFRIYYQDAASRPGTGIVPTLTGPDEAPVDVAILCVAGFSQVPGNPEHILGNVRPRRIVGGHWEDFFFLPSRRPIRSAPGTSLDEFVRRSRAVSPAAISMIEPGAMLSFPPAAR